MSKLENQDNSQKKGPFFKGQVGKLKIAVFQYQNKDGMPYFRTFIERSYFNKEKNQWLPAGFSEQDLNDLEHARTVANRAIEQRRESLGSVALAA